MNMKFYRRRDPDKIADRLVALADAVRAMGWEEKGGYLIRGGDGEVCGRTQWIPRALWWSERDFWFSDNQTAAIIEKRILGEPLTKLETKAVNYMLEVAGWEKPKEEAA